MAESYWMATARDIKWPPPDTDTTADVVVIGAGMAGLSTAWELTRLGRNVVVLESDRVVAGITGYTTANLTAAHSLVHERLRRTRGKEGARLCAHSQQAAVERVASVELGKCDEQAIRERALTVLARTDGRLCEEVAAGLGLPAPAVDTTLTDPEPSPALSQLGDVWLLDGQT